MTSSTKNRCQIPFVYRLTFNWIEPLLAFGGAVQSYVSPRALLAIQTPSVQYHDSMHPIFTQLAAGWVLLAFNDAVTLRLTQDVRVWTSLLTAGLLSDIIYTSSLVEDLGPAVFWNPAKWSFIHAFTLLTTIPPLLLKVAFIARIGLGPAWTSSTQAKKRS
ncbi:hypothetical protein BLS_008676 [Venturia inaequalis]|uniref:DUF7704 domain-containing protein n=1 Tax=Venturia inaequalis TaxID=5025 RepID=A0A8H3YLF7_VENIN|nr:hypothetical protein EG328_010968 [Venturia inaequalis]KAE9964058.1 hypothetical protein BLS_008676 [Venturia inaequalis]KAE9985585.1 hypothetical protein EG327_004629 [Venturia inaequalis]RDI82503.1 hypothetical protein Vi05172_g7563 [Venturia inaequalis]